MSEEQKDIDEGYMNEDDPRYPELVARITRAIRECDQGFQQTGGSSRHWVRDWFLPTLQKHNLKIVNADGSPMVRTDA